MNMWRSVYPELSSLSTPLLHSLSYLVLTLHIQYQNHKPRSFSSSALHWPAQSSTVLTWLSKSFQSLIPSFYLLPLLISSVLQHLQLFFSIPITCDCALLHHPHLPVIFQEWGYCLFWLGVFKFYPRTCAVGRDAHRLCFSFHVHSFLSYSLVLLARLMQHNSSPMRSWQRCCGPCRMRGCTLYPRATQLKRIQQKSPPASYS